MTIGYYLKLILIKKNISQKELWEKLNSQKFSFISFGKFDYGDIHKIVSDKKSITPLLARRIELALDLPYHFLVDFTYDTNKRWHKSMYEELEEFEEKLGKSLNKQ